MSIRRYIYISQSKIDTWLPQIHEDEKKEIAAEIGFNLGVLKGKIGTKREAGAEDSPLVKQCRLLEKYIHKKETVGNLESGETWIAGECQAKIFPLESTGIIFVGQLGSLVLAMTGASNHVVGAGTDIPTVAGVGYLPSFGFSVLGQLGRMAETDLFVVSPSDMEQAVEATVTRAEDPAWVRTIRAFVNDTSQPTQRIQCLAARLFDPYVSTSGNKFALYTPLFVAYA